MWCTHAGGPEVVAAFSQAQIRRPRPSRSGATRAGGPEVVAAFGCTCGPLRFAGGLAAPVLAPVVAGAGRRRPASRRPTRRLHPVGGPSAERGAEPAARCCATGACSPSARVLEIGCGVGRLAYELALVPRRRGTLRRLRHQPQGDRLAQRALRAAAAELPLRPRRRAQRALPPAARHRGRDASASRTRTTSSTSRARSPSSCTCSSPRSAHYFEEIARVPDARRLRGRSTFRVGERRRAAATRTRDREWVPVGDGVYWTIFPETPGRALAYDDALVRATIARRGAGHRGRGRRVAGTGGAADPATPTLGADVYVVRPAASA